MQTKWGIGGASVVVAAGVMWIAACVGDDAGSTTIIEKDGPSAPTPETSTGTESGAGDAADGAIDSAMDGGEDAGPRCDPNGELGIPLPVAGIGTAAESVGPIALSQKLTRTTYFVDGTLNFPIVKIIGEIGRTNAVSVPTYNSFAGAAAGAAQTFGALGVRFGL